MHVPTASRVRLMKVVSVQTVLSSFCGRRQRASAHPRQFLSLNIFQCLSLLSSLVGRSLTHNTSLFEGTLAFQVISPPAPTFFCLSPKGASSEFRCVPMVLLHPRLHPSPAPTSPSQSS